MTSFAKARSASSFAIAALLAFSMVPVTAYAADGAAATTQDAAEGNDGAAVLMESGDTASSWRFDDGEPSFFRRRRLSLAKVRQTLRGTRISGAKTLVFRFMLIRLFPVRALRYRATSAGLSALRASASM